MCKDCEEKESKWYHHEEFYIIYRQMVDQPSFVSIFMFVFAYSAWTMLTGFVLWIVYDFSMFLIGLF
jgi:hypothetical protein